MRRFSTTCVIVALVGAARSAAAGPSEGTAPPAATAKPGDGAAPAPASPSAPAAAKPPPSTTAAAAPPSTTAAAAPPTTTAAAAPPTTTAAAAPPTTTAATPAGTTVAAADVGAPPAASATATAAPAKPTKPPVEVHGFASLAFSHNFAALPDHSIVMRTFDTSSDSVSLDGVELSALREVDKPGDLGFRVDVVAGSKIPSASAAAGLFRDPTSGQAADLDLQQAYGSWRPADHITVDLGKFVTPAGYELIEGWDGWNDEYSHSFLFGYAIPFTHTGVRIAVPVGDVTITAYGVNGWDNALDASSGKTGGLNVLYTKGAVTAGLTWLSGKQPNWRHLLDAVASVTIGKGLVGVNGDWARETTDTGHATWYGAALYGNYSPVPKLTLAVRGEVFDDRDGLRTGTPQTLEEATADVQVHLAADAHLRAEVRYDHSNMMSFGDAMDPQRHQVTAALNAVATF